MELQHIELTDLKTTNVNVRKKGGKDIADLVPSIKSLGVLQPLLVRPNCEGYEIVAGQRRYHALLKLAEEGSASDPVPCIVMQDGDDAKAIEASLAENLARLPMDEIDQYRAFAALSKKGSSAADIAAQFGITERLVKQRLALGNLHPPILTAYRREEICAETLRILTMATPKQQKEWLERAKGKHGAPMGYRLKQWLFGGKSIPTGNALFDLAEYGGNIVSDLFGEDNYFDDAEKFWELQNQTIANAREGYLAEGWADVNVLDVGEYFPSYDYVDTPKNEGGKIYVRISHDGEVTFYEGQLSRKEVKRKQAKEDGGATTAPKAEITKAMQNYLALHRHSAVRTELLLHSGVALRLAVAQIIAGSELWTIHADPQKANTDAIRDSLAINKAEEKFADERRAVRELLSLGEDAEGTLVYKKDDWGKSHNLSSIFASLLARSDEDVTRILTFIVAETLTSGSAMVEILGNLLSVNMADHWPPDDTFFDLLRDKQAINAMLNHVGGKSVAEGNIAATAKVQKQIIRDFLSGTRQPQSSDWQPTYMRFPMQPYTKRGGIAAIDQWRKVKALFKAA